MGEVRSAEAILANLMDDEGHLRGVSSWSSVAHHR